MRNSTAFEYTDGPYHSSKTSRHDMLVINKKINTAQEIDFAIQHYSKVAIEESEKIEKYKDLMR